MAKDLESLIQDISSYLIIIESQNHYERLDATKAYTKKKIQKNYIKLAAKWHPDKFAMYDLSGTNAQKDLDRIIALLNESNAVLTNQKKREELDAAIELGVKQNEPKVSEADLALLLEADSNFRLGEQLLSHGNIKGALKKFEEANSQNPNSLKIQSFRAYCFYMAMPRNDQGLPTSEQYAFECKKIIQEALDEIENFDDGFVFLGKISQIEGNNHSAVLAYKKALSINKKNFEAQRELRLIAMRNKKPSVLTKLKSFFGK